MSVIPSLDLEAIKDYVSEPTFMSGESYSNNAAVFSTFQDGKTIFACCNGSGAEIYEVRVSFSKDKIERSSCTCSSIEEKPCKHVAALLLFWQKTPEKFMNQGELGELIRGSSKTELALVLITLVKHLPDLESLLKSILIARDNLDVISYKAIQHQVGIIFDRHSAHWDRDDVIAEQLQKVKERGDKNFNAGNYEEALTSYDSICTGIMDNYIAYYDESGSLTAMVNDCVAHISQLLQASELAENVRAHAINTLFMIYRFDVVYGSIGFGEEIPHILSSYTDEEERRDMIGAIEKLLQLGTDTCPEYQSKEYQRFLGILRV